MLWQEALRTGTASAAPPSIIYTPLDGFERFLCEIVGLEGEAREGMETCRPDCLIRVWGEAVGCPQFNDKALIGSVRSITIGMLSCGEARSCWVPNGEMSFRSALTQKS